MLIVPPFDFTIINSDKSRGTKQAGYYLYYPPLGLCSIAAVLEKAGYSAAILDGMVDAASERQMLDMVLPMKPKIVGFNVTTPALPVIWRMIKAVKERLGVPVIVGGAHISCDPEIIREIGADFGVVGDGETPMVRIADHLLKGVPLDPQEPGIITPDAPVPVSPAFADLSSLPVPARNKLRNPRAYFNPFVNKPTTTLLSARGCPFMCTFCCRTVSMGDYRPLDLEVVLDEMAQVESEGIGFVSLIDETFTYDRERAIALARGMRGRGFRFRWSCQTRAELADEEALREFRAAGCINVSFGVEAGDDSERNRLDKKIKNSDYERAFDACRRTGITINAFMMIGAPEETPENIIKTIELPLQLEPDYAVFNVGTLFPGSREYHNRLADGSIQREIWNSYMKGEADLPVLSKTLDISELSEYLRKGYSKFYMRPRYIWKKLISIRSAREVLVLARQARTVVTDYVIS